MSDLYEPKIQKTVANMTAAKLLKKAEIVETMSGDFFVKTGDFELTLSEDYWLIVSSSNTVVCQMELTRDEMDALEAMESKAEEMYGTIKSA